ncbi:MAG: C25 family cysteine peptidase [Bacteroidales bacterium]
MTRNSTIQQFLQAILLVFVLLMPAMARAQGGYGNEWIQYSQQYFAIPVASDGVYRLDYNTMQQAGVPLGSFDPRSFQIFARGAEIPIFVRNENTGTFLPGDFIEFYGEKNTGWFDAGFYNDPSHQPNANYSLINDTINYYLTWNNLISNKRWATSQDNNFSGYSPAPWFWFTSRQDYTSTYYAGETNLYGVTEPDYTSTEGWFDAPLNLGQSRTQTLPTPNIFTAGPQAQIEFAVAGASNYRPISPDHHLQVQFAGNLIDTIYEGYKLLRFQRNVAANSLNPAGTPFVFSSVNSLGTPVDRSAIVYISVRYPHNFNLRNLPQIKMDLPPSSGDRTLMVFTDFNAQSQDTVWVYNLTHNTRARAFPADNTWRAFVSNPTQQRQVFVSSSAQVKKVTRIRPVTTNSANFARFTNYLAPPYRNSDYLMITHRSLMEPAQAYRNFRNSTGYQVLLADVDELYHQFAYGITKHPMALRNFARFTLEQFETQPRKLFLIGKTLSAQAYRRNVSNYAISLVPSFGNPPSDVLITSGLDGFGYAPALGTGRLAAKNPAHVYLYLDKAMLHHQAQSQPQEWMKNILHFGGGSSINEQNILASYLRQYRNTMEDTLFGGYVRTFLKSSTDPIQINQSDSLKQLINNGVSIMTFFGHAAGIGFDISIDYPSEYNNFGKYPFLVANSCFAGDLFSDAISSSEEFVLIEEKGVIGYLAATTATGAFELNRYSNAFFKNIAATSYGRPVGHAIRETIREIQTPNVFIRNASLMKTLHGDPAVIINSFPKPDYTVEPSSIFFTPKEVTTEVDSFYVHVVSTNIGKAIRDSMIVELQRRFPDGSVQTLQRKVRTTLFKDTISFQFPVDREKGIGLNQFTALLDALNQVDELNKANNSATNNLLIKSSDIIPVYPHAFAVINTPQVTLKASTGDPFRAEKNYVFQVDTSQAFANPISHTISHRGGVVQWALPMTLTDSTVYFWRVSLDSVYTGEYNWRNSSFQYLAGKRGWSQAHFDQFGANQYQFVSYNAGQRKWEFVNSINSIQAQTGVYPHIVWTEQYMRKNNIPIEIWSCLADVGNGMFFAVFDPVSADYWISVNQGNNLGQYNNYHCMVRNRGTFDFYSTSDLWRERMRAFIDTIPQGHYVLASSHRNHNAQNYPEDLYQAFESLGSANIRTLQNNTPYLLFGIKGAPIGSSNEVIGSSVTSIIQLTDSILTNWNRGTILSGLIGPASKWEAVSWKQVNYDGLETDSVWLNVLGVKVNGLVDTLISAIPAHQTFVSLSEHNIDPTQYPFLRLQVNMMDDENRTPAQMKYWKVFYEGIPETALDPSRHFVFNYDTVPEGKHIRFSAAIHNIGDYPMDSLLVRYWVIDQNRQMHPIDYPRQRPHPVGDILIDTVEFSTRGMAGFNSLWMEVNPANDQLEQYHFNNIGQIPFFVEKDKTNPLLEVTFDGAQIMDGDIVSANPFIHITLRDENPYLALSDTSLVKVFLSTPMVPEPQRVYFRSGMQENMRFFPASLPRNECSIEFEPIFEHDGRYTLRVQATDKSLNESGNNDYVINFEVITQSTITEVLNWPNPFSTATHFVFTLTGSRLPTFMKIQILTITGKVVREIDMSELGPLRIGRNITQYAWDGTDQYGDRLANGVYLYRVITNIDGQQIELNPTAASRYFHQGFGKMYLIR